MLVLVSAATVAEAGPGQAAALTGGQRLQRAATCGGSAELPAGLDSAAVAKHCGKLNKLVAKYRARWLDKATPFLRKVVPPTVPDAVIYPFGGGDLLTALAVFPDLSEITTISLEPAGDARAMERLAAKPFRQALGQLRTEIDFFLRSSFSRTRHMHVFMTHGKLPGQLVFSLLALSIHGYELTDLRYFVFDATGTVTYLDAAAHKRLGPSAFDNVELRFRKKGNTSARVKTFRHVRQNLADAHLAKSPRFLAHLRGKGKVSVMTKAASYLLWWRKFSTLRAYLVANMSWMISDSSGMLPRHLRGTGFEQVTYGRFEGNILNIARHLTEEAKRLWKHNRYRRLGFRFGYPDTAGNASLLITRPKQR
jgi:hypothetical protein